MKFNFVSKPKIFPDLCEMHRNENCLEYDCDGELMIADEMELAEFFDTGKSDDYIAGYFLNYNEENKVVSIVGEISEEDIEEKAGESVDVDDILYRIELFSRELGVTWISEQLFDHDGTLVE